MNYILNNRQDLHTNFKYFFYLYVNLFINGEKSTTKVSLNIPYGVKSINIQKLIPFGVDCIEAMP